jgi:hypothetical protein
MVPSGIKIGKEHLNLLAYADDIVLIGKNETEIRQIFVGMENAARKFGLQINKEKTKYMIVESKNTLKQNKIGYLKIKYYKFETTENFKYLEAILNEDNNQQTDLQEIIKSANKKFFMLQNNTVTDKTLTYASET